MTKEQREAIKSLNEFANTKYGAFTAKEGQTVLNLIQEQQEENKKKDKIINLIINEFYKRAKISENCYIQKSKGIEDCLKHKNCKECLKQYFERKVEDVKN